MTPCPIRAKLDVLATQIQQEGANLDSCAAKLIELKIALTTLPGLQPNASVTEATIPDIMLARDVYEVAALLSLKQEDEISFERHVSQAKTYYVDYASVIPKSSRQNLILGLNLMRLLAQNRIAEFHTELELVPMDARSDKFIDYALRLEHYLMEGSYSKIREEKIAVPDALFVYFVDNLMVTVREEIADCSERAYASLGMDAAQRMLSVSSHDELMELCLARGWNVDNGVIYFGRQDTGKVGADQIPSSEMIRRSLAYARELEQII